MAQLQIESSLIQRFHLVRAPSLEAKLPGTVPLVFSRMRNERAQRRMAWTEHEAGTVTCSDCVDDSRWIPQAARTTRGIGARLAAGVVGSPKERGSVYPSEGFG